MASIDVDISNFDTKDMVEELENRGYSCSFATYIKGQLTEEDYKRIKHLSVIGQKKQAQEEALKYIGEAINRNLL